MRSPFLILLAALITQVASADWQLDSESSSLAFISVKNGTVVEAHRFDAIEGNVDTQGHGRVTVTLASVDTLIPIRDERMATMLFETSEFPLAIFETTDLPLKEAGALGIGETMDFELKGSLSLHGMTGYVVVPVSIARAGEGAYQVSSKKPVLVSADQFNLLDGIEALRTIAGLNAITPNVPVTFSLMFREN